MAKSKAVLIGVNDYAPVGPGGSDLNGCVNDVEDMANTLHILKWPKSTIKIVTDKRATTRRIRSLLTWLVKDANPGDRLLFYYSGHGSQVPNTDIDGETDDEADHLDEILCPHDLDWEGNYILDDEFAKALKGIPEGCNAEFIFDCCFSGSATRTLVRAGDVVGRNDGSGVYAMVKKSRYLAPPIDFAFHLTERAVMPRNQIVTVTKDSNHTLWSGGQEHQTVVEYQIGDRVRGAFTYHFCQILRASEGNICREEIYKILADALARSGEEQVPRIDSNPRMLAGMPFRKTYDERK